MSEGKIRSKQQRLVDLDRRLSEGQHLCVNTLAEQYGMSAKTIGRYLAILREDYNQPLERLENGRWRYNGPSTPLTSTFLSSVDRLPLLLSLQAIDSFAGTPVYNRLQMLHNKLLAQLEPEHRTAFVQLAQKIRFVGQYVKPINDAIWQTLMDALEVNDTLKMRYRTGRDAPETLPSERLVDPYGVIVRNREWNLLAWDHSAKEVRTFLFGRIESLEAIEQTFRVRDGFDLDKYLSTAVDGHQSTGPLENVRLRLSPDAPVSCVEHIWCPNQRVQRQSDGSHIVEFETAALFAVEREVLGWGGVVEVMGPRELARTLMQKSRQMLGAAGKANSYREGRDSC